MPSVVEPAAASPAGGIAAAIVNVGQNAMLNASTLAGTSGTSTLGLPDLLGLDAQEQLELLTNRLHVETRIKEGAENLLQVLAAEPFPDGKELARQVTTELQASKFKISNINRKLDELRDTMPGPSHGLRRPVNGNAPHSGSNRISGVSFARHLDRYSLFDVPHAKQKDSVDQEDIRTSLTQATALVNTILLHNSPLSPSSRGFTSSDAKTNSAKQDKDLIEAMNDLVATFERNVRVSYQVGANSIADAVMPFLSEASSKEARAAVYRVIRHAIVDTESAALFRQRGLDWYLIRSLSRDTKHGAEKEQALRLISRLLDIARFFPRSSSSLDEQERCARAADELYPLSDSVVRALIAVAEYPEDPFRLGCLILLADLLLFDIELVWRNGGMRALLMTLTEGPADVAPEIAMTLLTLVDRPHTRVFLDGGVDLEMALAAFTDAYGKGSGNADRMRASSKVITIMLRNWSGLMYFCMDDMKAIRSLIDTLRIRSLDTREVILDTFFEVLKIKTPEWYSTFLEGRRLTMYRHKDTSSSASKTAQTQTSSYPGFSNEGLKITDQFLALLLTIVSESGLLNALVGILEEEDCDANISRKATLLLGEILYMSNRLLPLSHAAKLQALPRLFERAAAYGRKNGRELASTAFSSIDSFNRNRARLQQTPTSKDPKRGRYVNHYKRRNYHNLEHANLLNSANSVEDTVRRNQRQVDQARLQYGMHIDDRSFQSLLIDTQVMSQTHHTKWNFDVLNSLIEGPLLNAKRLEEAMKGTRFGKKLMPFFWPRSRRFSNIDKTLENMRWVRLACSLITTLVTSPEGQGIRFLSNEDSLLSQLAACFTELLPFQGAPAPDPIFSAKRVENTLTCGYFDIIGVLSQYSEGVELMERHKIFTAFYHITELRSRDDLIKGIIRCLDYTIDGHPRVVLSKALTSSTKDIRVYATQHLGQLIRTSSKANEWTLRLLLTQLYDPDLDIATLAMKYLEDVCEDVETLELVVKMQPTLDHLGDISHPLLLRFMSTSGGFRYLYHSDYIDREIESWFHDRNFLYVVQVETYLACALGQADPDDRRRPPNFEGMVPPHFYGEMAKSTLGSQVLAEKGHFAEFAHFIRQHGLENDDAEIISRLKSVLWAVGNIGATIDGLLFLEEEEIIPVIVETAEKSLVLSVRGTCFYVLGLIATSDQGADILAEYGWEATLTPLGTPTGLCLPQDLGRFLHIPPWECPLDHPLRSDFAFQPVPQLVNVELSRAPTSKRAATRQTLHEHERDILDALSNLSNTVIANEAARSLGRLKARYASSFQSIPFLAHVMRVLATERFRLPVRRYILDQIFGSAASPASGQAPGSEGGTESGVVMDVENMRALQAEVRKLEAEERAYDEAQIRLRTSNDNSSGRSYSPISRSRSVSVANESGVAQPKPNHTTGGSVLAKYAPVRKPQAPVGVLRLSGFDT